MTENREQKVGDGIRVALPELLIGKRYENVLFGTSGRRVRSLTAGGRLSPFKGRGMEFDEVRPYHPGDDIRTVDWRVTARRGEAYTKLFQEERERPMAILTDLRPRMRFGTRGAFKSVVAARLASAVAWAGLAGNDKVGGAVLSASGYVQILPERTEKRVLRLLGRLVEGANDKSDRTGFPLSAAVARLRKMIGYGGIAFILSDFHDMNDDAKKHLAMLSASAEVFMVQILDPLEVEPPPPGVYQMSDRHGAHYLTLPADDRNWRGAYTRYFAKRRDDFVHFCRAHGIRPVFFRTDDRMEDFYRLMMANRQRRR